jgi:RNA polymerase primary sigma factor
MKNGKNGPKPGRKSSLSQQKLTREEEYELFERIKNGDKRAENIVVKANYGFVCDTARRYNGPDWNDLVQEGSLGMLIAIQKFDHTRGIRFITYAGWWVRAYMVAEVRRHYQAKRSPGSRYVVMRDLRKHWRRYTNLYGRIPTIEELSELLGLEKSTIVKALNCNQLMPSISSAVDGDDSRGWKLSHDRIPDTKTPSPLEMIEELEKKAFMKSVKQELKRSLKEKRSQYPERDVEITFAHMIEGAPLSELGRRHDISRERVRQINEKSAYTQGWSRCGCVHLRRF